MGLDEILGIDQEDATARVAALLVDEDERLIDRLIEMRRAAGLKQRDVAELLGITQSAIAKFESAERDPRLSTVRRYALAVGAVVRHDVQAHVETTDSDVPVRGSHPAKTEAKKKSVNEMSGGRFVHRKTSRRRPVG